MSGSNSKINPYYSILILGLIGLLRNTLEVLLRVNIHEKWWAFDLDVVFTTVFFVIHFCFFGSFVLHLLLKIFKGNIPYSRIFSFLFSLQFIHLAIPFIDKIGLILGVPYIFKILPEYNTPFFLSWTVMTLGIIVAWLIAGYLTLRLLVRELKVALWKSIVIIILLFNFFYWPTYHFYHTFNTLFDLVTHNLFSPGNVIGYGFYFMIASFVGIYYYSKNNGLRGKNM